MNEPTLKDLVLASVCSSCSHKYYPRGWGLGKMKMLVNQKTLSAWIEQADCSWCSVPSACFFVRVNVI